MAQPQHDDHVIEYLVAMEIFNEGPPTSWWDEIDAQHDAHVVDYNVYHERKRFNLI